MAVYRDRFRLGAGALAVAMIGACTSSVATPRIFNLRDAPMDVALPCGATELDPYEPARCSADASCLPSPVRRSVGSCTVAASSSFDLYAGHDRFTIFDGERAILSSGAPPYARRVVFDARVPTPHGIRVGMTGAKIERLLSYEDIECTRDDPSWRGHALCRIRPPGSKDCGNMDAEVRLVVFDDDVAEQLAGPISGDAARSLVREHRVAAIDLGPPCT